MSRRAVKRYEEALAAEKVAAADEAGKVDVCDDAPAVDGDRDVGNEPVSGGGPVNLFGLLLGHDEGEEDDDDDDEDEEDEEEDDDEEVKEGGKARRPQSAASEAPKAAAPADVTGSGRRRRKRGKKGKKVTDDEEWFVGDTGGVAESKVGGPSEEQPEPADLLKDPAFIPDSFFSLEDDEELRESARAVLADVIDIAHPDGVIPGALEALAQVSRSIVAVNPLFLSVDAELKRLFGARVVEHERVSEEVEEAQQRRRLRGQPARVKRRGGHLVQPRDTWWRNAPGLGMTLDAVANASARGQAADGEENVRYFRYHHERRYQVIQQDFRAIVATHNPSLLVELVSRAPYHVDTLLQLGEVHRQMGELDRAGELIERALYVLESTWSRAFKPFNGECRLRYNVSENRSLFLALFRHVQLLTRRGLRRTALESAKLYLNLDPPFDPQGALLMVDSLALLSGEFGWTRAMHRDYVPCSLELFPNFAISAAVADHCQRETRLSNGSKGGGGGGGGVPKKKRKKQLEDRTEYVESEGERAMTPLQKMANALLAFPMVLEPLLAAANESTAVCEKYELYRLASSASVDDAGTLLRISRIYAECSKAVWTGGTLALLKDAAVCAGAAAAGGRGKDGLDLAEEGRQLREDAAAFFRRSGAYDDLQVGDFGGSATNIPAELVAADDGDPPGGPAGWAQLHAERRADVGAALDDDGARAPEPEQALPLVAPVPRAVSPREAVVTFFRSLMPWYDSAEEDGGGAEAPNWDRLQELLARRDDGGEGADRVDE
jgi:tetratricopeptide (TPR) repeat protein